MLATELLGEIAKSQQQEISLVSGSKELPNRWGQGVKELWELVTQVFMSSHTTDGDETIWRDCPVYPAAKYSK